jgi:hypothetical protein
MLFVNKLGLLAAGMVFASSGLFAAVDFQREVQPILSDNCFNCHGPDSSSRMVGMQLDTFEGATAPRKNGTPIVPHDSSKSLILQRITATDPNRRMPPLFSHKNALTPQQIATLKAWIDEGAEYKKHWAFVTPVKATPPAVKNEAWARSPIDKFVLARIEAAGLSPAPEADRHTLVRRVALDLTGLPPAPADVDAFVNDKSPGAYEKMVDRFLASPRYGEHRAHYWLDAARYADTNGFSYDNYRDVWPWRDWVIKAFNRNMPFNQFAVEQLAGDLLPNPTMDQLIATGFGRNNDTNNENGLIEEEYEEIYAKDRADTFGTVFLGLTTACATCHDHKFDPISQKDHYAVEAFFRNNHQMVMDGNRPDMPPYIFVPRPEDRARWEDLSTRRESLRGTLLAMRAAENPGFDKWLASKAQANIQVPLAKADELATIGAQTLDSSQSPGVKLAKAPWSDTAALQFDGKSSITLPHTDYLDADKPFSVTLWVNAANIRYHKGLSGSGNAMTIASQMKSAPRGRGAPPPAAGNGDDAETAPLNTPLPTGWQIDLDQGVPEMRLYGDAKGETPRGIANGVNLDTGGRAIRAFGLQNEPLKPGVWYHLTFTYDGSRKQRGMSLYVNGVNVPIERNGGYALQNPYAVSALQGSMKNDSPLILGSAGKTGLFEGSIADLRFYNRVITEGEARVVAAAPVIAGAVTKDPAQLSDAEKDALKLYFLSHNDSDYRKTAAEFASVSAERRTIEVTSPMADARNSAVDVVKPEGKTASYAATAMIMQENTDSKPMAHVLYRGAYDQPREAVEPGVPTALPPMPASYPKNRLGLAQWLVDGNNPLTARVAVNRYWQEIFGTGIVRTSEDFGTQGEVPSHPELLDWMAVEFQDSGWDVKKLLKLMVTSATYRQSSAITPEAEAKDPEDRLLERSPRYRIDAEMVRDYALEASGLLKPTIGGPPVRTYQPAGIWEAVAIGKSNTHDYVQDHGDDLYRRSLYLLWKRGAPPPEMDVFGAPTREECTVRRERTNSPLQALVTLNDTQFVEAARNLAERSMLASNNNLNGEIDYMSARVLARDLKPEEKQVITASYRKLLVYYDSNVADARKLLAVGESKANARLSVPQLAALTMLANEFLNLDEAVNK